MQSQLRGYSPLMEILYGQVTTEDLIRIPLLLQPRQVPKLS